MRVGIHIGDVTRTEHDIYGDGINIAARLETDASEGGILISDAVYSSLDGTLSPSFEEAGARNFKNIDRPIITWQRAGSMDTAKPAVSQPDARSDFPKMTIVPVSTTDTRSEVIDLANALTADIFTAVSGVNWLVTQVSETPAQDAYVIQPTLRTRGDRLRLETRVFAPDGSVVRNDKSETTLDQSFDWQDEVVDMIAAQSTELIFETENLRLAKIPEQDLTSEHYLLMGIMAWRTFSTESYIKALYFHDKAIEARPDLADAYAEAITVLVAARTMGTVKGIEKYRKKMPDWIAAARPLAAGHPMLTYAIGIATYMEDRRLVPLNQVIGTVMRLAPFNPRLLSFCGWAYLWSGQPQTALDCQERSVRFGMQGPFTVASLAAPRQHVFS